MAWCSLICGNASKWVGEADLVLTSPYAPLPECLHGKPAIIVQKARGIRRIRKTEEWVGSRLSIIGQYADVGIYIANLTPVALELDGLKDGEFYPLELPLMLLLQYGKPGMTVWDGFMGRGTVGRACAIFDMNFIGIDIDPKRVELARQYLADL